MKKIVFTATMAWACLISGNTWAMDMAAANGTAPASLAAPETRQLLDMPAAAKLTMQAEMIERLQALQQIMQALADGKPEDAAQVAKSGIGTGVMMRHAKRAKEAIPRNYMPEAMLPLSKQSHMLGDQLAEALSSGDRKRIDTKLAEVLNSCVACHRTYRIH